MEVTGGRSWTHVVVVGLAALREEGFGVGAEVQELRGVSVHRVELLGRGHARGGAALAVPHDARSRVPRRTHAFGGSDGSARADAPFRRERVRDLSSVGHRPMEIGREWVRGWISRKWMRWGAGSTRHARRNGDAGDEDPRLLNGDSSWGARRGTVHGKTKRRTSILPQSPSNAPAPPRISRAVGSPRGVALMRPTMETKGQNVHQRERLTSETAKRRG